MYILSFFLTFSFSPHKEYVDGDLSAWINRERFQGYLNIDGFTLYELGDTGKMTIPSYLIEL